MTSRAMQQLQLDLPYDLQPAPAARPACLGPGAPELPGGHQAARRDLGISDDHRAPLAPHRRQRGHIDSRGSTRSCASSPTSARAWPTCCPRCRRGRGCGASHGRRRPTVRTPRSSDRCGPPQCAGRAAVASFAYGAATRRQRAATGSAKPRGRAARASRCDRRACGATGRPSRAPSRSTGRRTTTSAAACSTTTSSPVRSQREVRSTNIFLSGDSVGHLGGWVEGAAMSAINAVVGVCSRIGVR